jgi:hypothetical protein
MSKTVMKTLWNIALTALATKNIGKNTEKYIILWLVYVMSVKGNGTSHFHIY